MNAHTSNTSPDPEYHHHTMYEAEIVQELQSNGIAVAPTTERFSLARPNVGDIFMKDLTIHLPQQRLPGRLLAVENTPATTRLYEGLQRARIPQLSRWPVWQGTENVALYAAPAGTTLLSGEPYHDRTSSPTYISDREIFARVGQIYGKAYASTGALLLDRKDQDSPLDHIALCKFAENVDQPYLYLCPPYSEDIMPADAAAARHLFTHSMRESLHSGSDLEEDLLRAADAGFVQAIVETLPPGEWL